MDKYIYVIGGYNGLQLNTVERYDTEKQVWDFVSSMKIQRSALSVTVLDGRIYAMGKQIYFPALTFKPLYLRKQFYSDYFLIKDLILAMPKRV